jgi:hypothetical protein
MMRLIGLLIFFLYSECCLSQIVNIENKRIYDDTSGWSGAVDVSFSFIQNKEAFYNLNAKSRVQYKTRKHAVFVLSEFMYSGGQKVYANSGMGHLRYTYRLYDSGWKWETYAQVQYNQLLNQRLRALSGTGIRAKLVDYKKVRLFAGTGAFYEYEEIQPNNEFNKVIRWSSYLSWFMNFKHFSFTGTTYFQPVFSELSDYRFAGQYVFQSQITKSIRFRTELNLFYDSKPPENVRSTISSFLVGLGYDFGK